MKSNLQKWQHSMIRNNIMEYRKALENYYIKTKPIVELGDGAKAFSLLSPPLGSMVARRRIRCIMNNITDSKTKLEENGNTKWGNRTPHFLTVAVTCLCQCSCKHCSADEYKKNVLHNNNALNLDEFKDAIAQSIELGTTCIILTGGEPLLYEDIYDLISAVDKSRSICTIFTNGEHLTEDTVKKLKKNGIYFPN